MNFRSFMVRLIIYTAAIAIVLALTNYFFPFFHSFRYFSWIALFYFFLLTAITGYIGLRSLEKSPHGFVASVNGIVLIKLFLSVALIIAYMLLVKPDGARFIISFFIFYIIYTVFEVRELVMAQKKPASKN